MTLTRGQKGHRQTMWGMSIYRKIFLLPNIFILFQAFKNSNGFYVRPLPSTISEERLTRANSNHLVH